MDILGDALAPIIYMFWFFVCGILRQFIEFDFFGTSLLLSIASIIAHLIVYW